MPAGLRCGSEWFCARLPVRGNGPRPERLGALALGQTGQDAVEVFAQQGDVEHVVYGFEKLGSRTLIRQRPVETGATQALGQRESHRFFHALHATHGDGAQARKRAMTCCTSTSGAEAPAVKPTRGVH